MVRRLSSAFVVVLALVLGACRSSEPVPQLLTLLDAGPRVTSNGDALEIVGSGFPPRKSARITLVGTAARPGHEAERDVAIDLEGTSATASKIVVTMSDAVVEQICGKGDAAVHTTFRGDLEVSFPAATPGALPITGTLHDVVLDVRPALSKRALSAAVEEGARVAALLGMKLGAEPSPSGGLVVVDVTEDGAADQAGVMKNDVLVTLDGWNVLDVADLVPSGRHPFVTFGIRRDGAAEIFDREVPLRGYKPRASSDLLAVALLLGSVGLAFLFFASPFARALAFLERAAAKRAPRRGDVVGWAVERALVFFRGDGASRDPLAETVPAVLFLAVSALAGALPFGRQLLGADVDAALLLVVAAALAIAVALAGGRRADGRWSLVRSLRLAAWTTAYHAPAALSIGCAIVLSGGMSVADAVHAQGGAPWHWAAFQTPFGVMLLALFFVPAAADPAPPVSTALVVGRRAPEGPIARAFAWASAFVLAMLATSMWLGGWALPFVDRAAQERSFVLQALGAALFLAKIWGVTLLVALSQGALPRVRMDRAGAFFLKGIVPAGIAAAALTAGWTMWDPAPVVRRALGLVAFGATTLLAVHVARRIVAALRGAPQPHVSPFL